MEWNVVDLQYILINMCRSHCFHVKIVHCNHCTRTKRSKRGLVENTSTLTKYQQKLLVFRCNRKIANGIEVLVAGFKSLERQQCHLSHIRNTWETYLRVVYSLSVECVSVHVVSSIVRHIFSERHMSLSSRLSCTSWCNHSHIAL